MDFRLSQLQRFVVAGLFNTAFSFSLYALAIWIGLAYPVANFLAMVGGICVGFATQGRFVFGRLEARRFPFFALTWLFLWGLNVVLIGGILPFVGSNPYLAGAAVLPVMVVLSFIVQKHIVFSDRPLRF